MMTGPAYVAFAGDHRVGSGSLVDVAIAAKRAEADRSATVLVFDLVTGEVVDLDLRGSFAELTARYVAAPPTAPRRGRPKLGVTSREVTLLPRHWEWLARQPGGASAAIRRMIDAARKANEPADQMAHAREAAYRFMRAMAGDRPGFEEASRSLFRADHVTLNRQMSPWPPDIRAQVQEMLRPGGHQAEPQAPLTLTPE
jgi:uncharacterized protein